MMRLLVYIALFLACLQEAHGATVVFEGSAPDNRRAVERLGDKSGVGADSIATFLVNQGYLDARAWVKSDTVFVKAGDVATIEAILWADDSSRESYREVRFTQKNLESLIEQKLRFYREQGYFYSTAAVSKVVRRNDRVNLEIQLNRGPQIVLGKMVFTGLKRTRPELVSRYIAIDSGEVLNEANLSYAERRGEAIPFVNFRPPIKVRPLPGYTSADLEFVFEEKKQVFFSGGGGIVPGSSSSLVWNLDLRFQNMFGGGRLIQLTSEKKEKDHQVLEIAYRQPVLLLGVGEAGFNAATRDYRDLFYEFSLKADYRTRLSRAFFAGLELGWRNVEPTGTAPSYSAVHSAFSLERNTLDEALNPSSGLVMLSTISFGYRRYSTDSLDTQLERNSFNETRAAVGVQWYQRLKGRLVGHLRLNYTGLETGESLPPISELYYIGGPGSLRGYRNEQFTAIRSAYGTVEPRIRFDGGNLFVFGDAAYLNNRVRDIGGAVVTDEFYRYSYGLGVTIIDRERLVKISVGWNPDSSFDQPRISLEFSADI